MARLQLRKCYFSLAYILLAILAVLSLMPAPDIAGNDKIYHFLTYALLSAWFSLIVERRSSLWRILFGLIGYGLLLEFLQSFTSYRQGDMLDTAANSLGVITGLAFYFSPLRRVIQRMDVWLLARL